MGCSNNVIKFIKYLTLERIIHADLIRNDTRLTFEGVLQEDVLSPLLYIIYVSDIMKNTSKLLSISQFADDIAIYAKFSSLASVKS